MRAFSFSRSWLLASSGGGTNVRHRGLGHSEGNAVFASRIIKVPIARPYAQVYEFLADPLNFARWASVPGSDVEPLGGHDWLVEVPRGPLDDVEVTEGDRVEGSRAECGGHGAGRSCLQVGGPSDGAPTDVLYGGVRPSGPRHPVR